MEAKRWLSLNYFLQYAVQGVFFQYWLFYLTVVKNMSVLDASIAFSMVYLARFISGVFISPIIINKFGLHKSYKIISVSGLISALLYYFAENSLMLLIVTFLFGLTFFSLTPLTETTASLFLKKENIDYGKVRVFGSFSFMFIGIIIGGLISYINNEFIYYAMLLLVIIYVIFTYLPAPKLLKEINKIDNSTVHRDTKPYAWLKDDKNGVLLILTFFFLQISHAAYNNYSVLYVESLNISVKWLTGFIVNISVISEIIFFTFSARIIRNIDAKKLLLTACLVATFRWLTLGLFKNVYVFSIMQISHAVTFALAQLSFILILNSKFSVDKTLDMQNLYSAVGFQLSAFIGMYIVGSIWEISTSLVFIISSVIAFIAFITATRIKFKNS